MEQSASSEANTYSAFQETSRLFWNPTFNFRVHYSLRKDSILSQTESSLIFNNNFNIRPNLSVVFQVVSSDFSTNVSCI